MSIIIFIVNENQIENINAQNDKRIMRILLLLIKINVKVIIL